MEDDDALHMPDLDPILSAVVDQTMTVDINAQKSFPPAAPKIEEPLPDQRLASLEERLARLHCEELRGVILTGVVLNMNTSHLRKRVIECVHKHLVNKHRVLEFLVARKIVPLSAIKDDLRLLQLEKQEVLDLIDQVLSTVQVPEKKIKPHK
jgi:hypothetical protein